MNPIFRFIWWLLSPAPFLAIRVVADLVATVAFTLQSNWTFTLWFAFVTAATVVADLRARRMEKNFKEMEP